MSAIIDYEIREFVKQELPFITTIFFSVVDVADDSPLQDVYEVKDVNAMIEKFFQWYEVEHSTFDLDNYFPWKRKSLFSKTNLNPDKKALTISMIIESAKVGRWLYD